MILTEQSSNISELKLPFKWVKLWVHSGASGSLLKFYFCFCYDSLLRSHSKCTTETIRASVPRSKLYAEVRSEARTIQGRTFRDGSMDDEGDAAVLKPSPVLVVLYTITAPLL